MFADVKLLHDLHAVHHLQSLSMANPRGLGFEDEPINASDYIISGISGKTAVAAAPWQKARRASRGRCARAVAGGSGAAAGRCSRKGGVGGGGRGARRGAVERGRILPRVACVRGG